MNVAKLSKKDKARAKRHRKLLKKQLGEEMSRVSKECYYAEWLKDTEFVVPELCRRAVYSQAVQHWGYGEITPERAMRLMSLANELGHWVRYDFQKHKFKAFNPFPLPEVALRSMPTPRLHALDFPAMRRRWTMLEETEVRRRA